MNETVNEGISLGDIFKAIWKKKILICIITAISLVVVFLAITFGYNPYKVSYSSQFELSFSGADEGLYPTGEIFNFKDMVSKDKLIAVKESDPKYNGIDVEKMYKKDGVKIQKVETDSTELDAQFLQYVITIDHSRVQDTDLMADFVSDLVNITIDDITVKSQKTNYVSDLKKYNDNILYSDAITYLIEQTEVITDGYDKLISDYNELYVVNDVTLKSYKAEALKVIKATNLEYYLSEAEKNVYLTSSTVEDEYEAYAEARVVSLLRKKQLNDQIIDEYSKMIDTSISGVNYTEQMNLIAKENAEIIIELSSLCYFTADSTNKDFKSYSLSDYTIRDAVYDSTFNAKVNSIYSTIQDIMTTYENNVRESNLKSILLSYDTNLIVVRTGVFNMVISAVAGIFVGLVIGAITAMIIELPKLSKKEEKEEA